MENTQTPAASGTQKPPWNQTFAWTGIFRPILLSLVFQYAYMAFYIGLRAAVALTLIDGAILLYIFVNNQGVVELDVWLVKTLIEWPILGLLAAHGYLDWISSRKREFRDRWIDAILMGGLIVVLTVDILILIHEAL